MRSDDFSIIGDPHSTHKSLDNITKLQQQVEVLDKPVIWLGDLLDTKEIIRGKCLNSWIRYFKNSKLQHYIVVGNHDWFNLECQDYSLFALTLLPNVCVVDKPMRFENLPFLMIPYIHSRDELNKILESGTKDDILICHIDAVDFDYGNGFICETGVSLDQLKKFKRVISGHFHAYQEKGNLTYIGTPFSNSFGEANQKKFIGNYNIKTNELSLSETKFPQHISIEFDCDQMTPDCQHWFFPMDDKNGDLWKQHHYRIILKGTQENINRFPKHFYDEAISNGKLDMRFISRPTQKDESQVGIDETISNESQFATWAKGIKNLDDETVKLGLQILEAVK